MTENGEIDRKKCGVIYILPDDTFALICDFCGVDSNGLDDLRVHLNGHFPTHIKIEDNVLCDDSFTDAAAEPVSSIQDERIRIEQNEVLVTPNERRTTRSCTKTANNDKMKRNAKEFFRRRISGRRINYNESKTRSGTVIRKATSDDRKKCIPTYKCSYCAKIFTTKQRKNIHNLMHRPHKCDLCSKAFTQAGTLLRHVKANHPIDPQHECALCEKIFATQTDVEYHTRKKHLSAIFSVPIF